MKNHTLSTIGGTSSILALTASEFQCATIIGTSGDG
jgi:hypothetical protein